MEPLTTIPVADQSAINTLPRHRRPLAHLADVQRTLLDCRTRIVAAGSIAGGRLDRSLVAEAVGYVDDAMDTVADLSAGAAALARQGDADRQAAILQRVVDRAAERAEAAAARAVTP